jgi:hypothetical protein
MAPLEALIVDRLFVLKFSCARTRTALNFEFVCMLYIPKYPQESILGDNRQEKSTRRKGKLVYSTFTQCPSRDGIPGRFTLAV